MPFAALFLMRHPLILIPSDTKPGILGEGDLSPAGGGLCSEVNNE